jgi:hypothetical protein
MPFNLLYPRDAVVLAGNCRVCSKPSRLRAVHAAGVSIRRGVRSSYHRISMNGWASDLHASGPE